MTTNTFVPEVGRYLMPVELQIWNGELLAPTLCKYYQDLWRAEFAARLGLVHAPMPVMAESPPQKLGRTWCKNLGVRLTHDTGCISGWGCKWTCGIYDTDDKVRVHLGQVNETKPNSEDDCQSCPSWFAGEKPT